jgi:uncharacterized membrane-anchored protein YhcB (DUF1043 family)
MISKKDADNLLNESREELVDMLCIQSELVDDLTKKLEALQQPKSCSTCKHLLQELKQHSPFCIEHNYWFTLESKEVLLCNRYEAKE